MEKLLVWDIDGTLISCFGLGREAMNKAFRELHSIDNAFDSINMGGRLDSTIIEEAYNIHEVGIISYEDFYNAYDQVLGTLINDREPPVVYDGVLEILSYVHDSNIIYNSIATGNCYVGAKHKLERAKIDHFFEVGGYGDEARERHELIEIAILRSKETFGIDFARENIYVIGDTPLDIEGSKRVGVKSIAVLTGGYEKDALAAYGPDFIFENLSDFEGFLSVL